MSDNRIDALIRSLPLVEGEPESTIDAGVVGYVEQALQDMQPELHARIVSSINSVYAYLTSERRITTDPTGRLMLTPDQLRGVIALSVLRGAAEVVIDISGPLEASRRVEEIVTGTLVDET